MDVLITCPSQRDRTALAAIEGYRFHLLDAPLNPRTPSPELDLLAYTDLCREYIRKHHIDAVFYSRDVADIVAAALCEEFGFRGPSVESVFLCLHKYYSRLSESAPVRCAALDLHAENPSVPGYPCYIKPPWLNLGILGFKLESPQDLHHALTVARREYGSWSPLYFPFFRRYIDQQRYPLAARDIMLVEEFIDGPQVTVEGWVEDNQPYIWAITDTNTYPGTRVIDNFSLPSRHSPRIQMLLEERAKEAIGNVGLNNGFFNIEFWCHEDTATLTEINGRAATCFYNLYRRCLNSCVYEAGLALATGRRLVPSSTSTGAVGGQFNFITFAEDQAEHLFDFAQARALPQLTRYVSPGDRVKQVSEFGTVLAQIDLFGGSYEEIHDEAQRLRRLLLRKPESSPW
ncbi:MAG: ATP-grasp domain-containing protein [Deltaproteobacteria bacterium]|nr:ATP-grasp domain-containing protein [Deltaproteobacteria bacterium]